MTKPIETNILPLNRPEYIGSGEGILSALAWSLVEDPSSYAPSVYEIAQRDSAHRRTYKVLETRPNATGLVHAIAESYGVNFGFDKLLDDGLLDVFRGVIPAKAIAYPSLPLVPKAAFLQDPRGVKGKKNPANYARIIEQFYFLGSMHPEAPNAAATTWFDILSENEPAEILRALDDIAGKAGPVQVRNGVGQVAGVTRLVNTSQEKEKAPEWIRSQSGPNPFQWFKSAWDTLCTPQWKSALPRRRWCDWLTCVIRTALGMGYLWEAQFYIHLNNLLSDPEKCNGGSIQPPKIGELLRWTAGSEKVTARDVNGNIRPVISLGDTIRKLVEELIANEAENQPSPLPLAEMTFVQLVEYLSLLVKVSGKNPFQEIMETVVKSKAPNTIETVVYSLLCRAETGTEADFYSMLVRRSRRFLIIEPGPEWIVVMASLAAKDPGRSTTLGQVKQQLQMLGLRPSRQVMVNSLEQSGLTRSSHDSDDALEVAAAF